MNDMNRLDMLNRIASDGILWICRKSTTGRGMRLHQDPKAGKYRTARDALDAYFESNQGES